jgi:hypothetical protein
LETNSGSLIAWLRDGWPTEGPAVVFMEGFSGVGKSRIGRQLTRQWNGPAARVEVPEQGLVLEDLLLDTATRFDEVGNATMSDRDDLDLVAGFRDLMRSEALLVVDNAQLLQDPITRVPSQALLRLVEYAADGVSGRLLLITNHAPAEGMWLDDSRRVLLSAPRPSEAVVLLDSLLKDRGREEEIPVAQRADVVRWLGGNPRALRALVACLEEEPLEALIEIEPDAWQLRDEVVSPQLIQKLETYFLTRTLDQLDTNSLLMLELLSIYRKPFRPDAIERLSTVVADVSAARAALVSRYLIDLDRGYFFLHPVIRRLARVRLEENVRREHNAHRAAADHFSRRLKGATAATNLRVVGEAFVEARYHLLALGRDTDFEAIASDYRRELLAQYRSPTAVPTTVAARRQLLVTLQGALGKIDRGYANLRVLLARLLLERGQPDDDRLALRQLSVAARDSKDPYCWKTRLELTLKLEGPVAGRAVANQALDVLHQSNKWLIVLGYASWLIQANGPATDVEVLKWLEQGLNQLPAKSAFGVYSYTAFVLVRNRRRPDAIKVLLEGYQHLGTNDANSWRLLEEAAFIAAAVHDQDGLSRVRNATIGNKWGETLTALCDVLALQSKGQWWEAAEAAGSSKNKALVAQKAFSTLCAGDPEQALRTVMSGDLGQNRAGSWLKALLALCARQSDMYMEEISASLGAKLGEEEASDPALWLRIWDEVPDRVESYPAFYFPRLPTSLTGLDVELVRLAEVGHATSALNIQNLRLPAISGNDGDREALGGLGGEGYAPAPVLVTVEGNLVMSNDSYNVSGQAGAVGPSASVSGGTFNQFVGGMNGAQLGQLASELARLREMMREAAETPEQDMAVAEIATAEIAAEKGDTATVERSLSKAGKWAWSTANAIGTSLAASALKAALGL